MNRLIRISCLLLLTGFCTFSYGQMEQYDYKRELKGISEDWHRIELPNEIFGKTSQNLSDLRVFGITNNKDTIEAPYLLRIANEKTSSKDIEFKLLNTSHNDKGYFFTFEIPTQENINQIKLDFKQKNFDWKVRLEGSQNQKEWFTVIEDYRILSIKNDLTNFQFTNLSFPSSKYRYFRLFIESNEKPELLIASIAQKKITQGNLRNYDIKTTESKENKQAKTTEIDIDLELPVRVSQIKIYVSNNFNYYRPIMIKYLTDSIKTEKGWKYNDQTLTTGTLNSLEENEFKFTPITAKKLKIFIANQNNQPLIIDSIHVGGNVHDMITRITEPATYFLTYGNKSAAEPTYDIERFTDKIPTTMKSLELGKEQTIEKSAKFGAEPLFKNKLWLWAIIGIIIFILGVFTIKMMRTR